MLGYFEGCGIPVWIEDLFGHFLCLNHLGGQSRSAQQRFAL